MKYSFDKDDTYYDLYLISKFLYLNDNFLISNKIPHTNKLQLTFLSKQNKITTEYNCVSIDRNGEKMKERLIFNVKNKIDISSFIFEGTCQVMNNYNTIYIEKNNQKIEITNIIEKININKDVKRNNKVTCILPLFLYGNTDIIKSIVEEKIDSNIIDIYGISFKDNDDLDKFGIVKVRPWFIFTKRESLNRMRDFNTISFTKSDLLKSTQSSIYDCYLRHKDTSKEITFLNINKYSSNNTISLLKDIFISLPKLINTNNTKNNDMKIYKNVLWSLANINDSNYIYLSQYGECSCNGVNCNDVCKNSFDEKMIKIKHSNTNVIKEQENKNDMNDFNFDDTEYFEDLLLKKCGFLFDDNHVYSNQNTVTEAFSHVINYFKGHQSKNFNKRCYLSLNIQNVSCQVSSLTFKKYINDTHLYVPINNNFLKFNDGCHF